MFAQLLALSHLGPNFPKFHWKCLPNTQKNRNMGYKFHKTSNGQQSQLDVWVPASVVQPRLLCDGWPAHLAPASPNYCAPCHWSALQAPGSSSLIIALTDALVLALVLWNALMRPNQWLWAACPGHTGPGLSSTIHQLLYWIVQLVVKQALPPDCALLLLPEHLLDKCTNTSYHLWHHVFLFLYATPAMYIVPSFVNDHFCSCFSKSS